MELHCLPGHRKPHLKQLDSVFGILLVLTPFVKPASHRLRDK